MIKVKIETCGGNNYIGIFPEIKNMDEFITKELGNFSFKFLKTGNTVINISHILSVEEISDKEV